MREIKFRGKRMDKLAKESETCTRLCERRRLMSANNCYVILPYEGKYYGWDEMAEESVTDADHGHKRILSVSKARYAGKSLKDVYRAMAADDMFAPEYGIVSELNPILPKDGTPIEVMP